jgi:hypothetical protein
LAGKAKTTNVVGKGAIQLAQESLVKKLGKKCSAIDGVKIWALCLLGKDALL